MATSLNNLAALLYNQSRLDKALQYFMRALEVSEMCYGPLHLDVARALNNLAVVLNHLGESKQVRVDLLVPRDRSRW